MADPQPPHPTDDGDLGDMLQELRILLQGSQLFTGFLIVIPFSERFGQLDGTERWIYVGTFVCSLVSLILFSAPAVHHRIARPLQDRDRFKDYASRTMLAGVGFVSLAVTLATQLVMNEVMGRVPSLIAAAVMAILVAAVWWVAPLSQRARGRRGAS